VWLTALRSAGQNEGRKVNHMEVAAEKRRAADPVGEAKRQRELTEMRVEKRKREKEEADAGEMEEEEEAPSKHLSMTLEQAEALKKKQDKKEKGKAAFGWDVFNQDSLHKAHKKNLAKLNPDLEAYEAAKAEMGEDFYRDHNSLAYGGEGFQPSEDKVEGMVQNLLDAAERRNKFSRRRPEVFEANVDSINDRNKHFNKKIERAFGAYTKVIKENLERGTAI
jgi:pre-mRNA-splicing factor SYF2